MNNNFKIVKFLKIEWIKNLTQGGAQDYLINNNPINDRIIKSDTQKHGQMWSSVSNEQLLKIVEKNNGIQEVLTKYPIKAYFDIDEDSKDEELLNRTINLINKYFPNADIAVSGSITDIKTSYHIALNNYIINNPEDLNYLKSIVKVLKETESSFDDKVYTRNRNFKCVNQSKRDGRIQDVIINDDLKKHLLTCYFNETTQNLPVFDYLFGDEDKKEIRKKLSIQKSKKPFDLGDLPKLELKNINLDKDIDTFTPLELLTLIPLDKTFDHKYTHLIARFCYFNDLTFEHFISWYSKKSTEQEKINKWKIYHWKDLPEFPPVQKITIINILMKYYPNIRKSIKLSKFEDLFTLPTDKIEVKKKLKQSLFDKDEKFIILNTAMGSGKTHQTIKYLKTIDSFIWMTPIIALAQNTKYRLKEEGIKCHYYKDSKDHLDEKDKLIICINSLEKTYNKTYKVVVIDEVETLLHKWFDNKTLNDSKVNKLDCWNRFIDILRNADKVIFLDAFTSKITTNFIEQLKGDYKIINSPTQEQKREIQYLPDFYNFLQDIIDNLKKDKKLFIFFPFKSKYSNLPTMSELVSIIEKETNKKGVHYHAEQDDKILEGLEDVNKSWARLIL